MSMPGKLRLSVTPLLLGGLLYLAPLSTAAAEDGAPWRVSKSSGEVWTTTSGVQNASLNSEALLQAGDSIRTGPTGRVLLTRGQETILISPNSVVALPTDQKDGLSTTIIEQAGSILIQAEKRNVKHFQVETPYLAAVVKGTHFRVDVTKAGGHVEVLEGKVEVADFKTGEIALVLSGQSAKVSASGNPSLSLSGTGKFNRIERGTPRAPAFERIPVPKKGFATPNDVPNGKTVHALGPIDLANNSFASADAGRDHSLRITVPLGEVNLNFVKATDGLAHGADRSQAELASATRHAVDGDAMTGNAFAKSANQEGGSGTIANNSGGNGGAGGSGLALGTLGTVGTLTGNSISGGNGKALDIILGRARALGRL
jgi:FecR-like protein